MRRWQSVFWGRSGLPGAGKCARPSGLQRICWILSKTQGSEPVARNGAGGWLTELSNQRAPIFRIRRPRRCGPQPIKIPVYDRNTCLKRRCDFVFLYFCIFEFLYLCILVCCSAGAHRGTANRFDSVRMQVYSFLSKVYFCRIRECVNPDPPAVGVRGTS